jgi:hypothetical protein
MLLMRGCCRESGYGHSGQVANYQIFSKARSPQRELDRIFTNVQNSKPASRQHLCVANFGFEKNTGNYDASVALAQKSSHADALQQ